MLSLAVVGLGPTRAILLADRMGAYGIRCRLASDVVVVVCDDLYCGETVHHTHPS